MKELVLEPFKPNKQMTMQKKKKKPNKQKHLRFGNIARFLLKHKIQNFTGEQQNQLKPEFS